MEKEKRKSLLKNSYPWILLFGYTGLLLYTAIIANEYIKYGTNEVLLNVLIITHITLSIFAFVNTEPEDRYALLTLKYNK